MMGAFPHFSRVSTWQEVLIIFVKYAAKFLLNRYECFVEKLYLATKWAKENTMRWNPKKSFGSVDQRHMQA